MITFMKELYPELTQADFDEYIVPLKEDVENLPTYSMTYIKNVKINQKEELYPYHKTCKLLATNIWDSVWDNNLNKYIQDSNSFRNTGCEILSQLAFSYLIRCFAEQIKTITKHQMSPEETYIYYTKKLIDNELREFAEEYPVAWRRCNNMLRNKINAIKDAVRATIKHKEELEKVFGISANSCIKTMDFGGDTHNNGAAVSIITFEDGKKVVFKPRSVSGEWSYAMLIHRLNEFMDCKMLTLDALDFGEYGYTSYVCSKNEENDMKKVGRLACLMYLLNATDMHYSNILWTSEGPLPIDLETLFHPARVRKGISESAKSAYRSLETSVYGTGILPLILTSKNSKGAVDVGFAGTRDENSVSPFKNFDIIDGFTSRIKVIWNESKIDYKLSTDKDLEAQVYERCEQIVSGFTEFFNQVIEHKAQFREAVLDSFSGASFRYIHNMTYRYMQIQRCLADAEPSRNIDIAHSLLSRIGILDTTSQKGIVVSECKQLWNGDIPYFYVKFDGLDIYNEKNIVAQIRISPKDEFLLKMDKLSCDELERQVGLIRLAFLAKLADPHAEGMLEYQDKITYSKPAKKNEDNTNKEENARKNVNATEVISHFAKSLTNAVLDDRYSHLPKTWIGPVVRYRNPAWTPGVLGYDLYAGRVGIALALAVAGKVLSDDKALEVATDVFDRSVNILEAKTYELRNVLQSGIGAFSGVSGLIWSLGAAGKVTNNKKWCESANNAWGLLPDFMSVCEAEFFDMIMGPSASMVMKSRMNEDWIPDEETLKKCIEIARVKIKSNDSDITSGLAHGYAQMLWFFAIMAQKNPSEDIYKIIRDIDEIIKNEYVSDGLIQVYSGGIKQVSSSWCNGLTGLLIAYYEAYKAKALDKSNVIDIINQIKSIPLSCVPIMCHGSLGISEALSYVSESFTAETSEIIASLKREYCSPDYIYKYFKTGKGRYPLSPGLMAGKAGALLYLCRSVEPEIKCSPLTFGI